MTTPPEPTPPSLVGPNVHAILVRAVHVLRRMQEQEGIPSHRYAPVLALLIAAHRSPLGTRLLDAFAGWVDAPVGPDRDRAVAELWELLTRVAAEGEVSL